MNLSDGQLVEKAKAGDTAAYGELFNRYQSKIYNFAYSLAGNSEDAKDTAQQAFIKVYEALPRLEEINFSAYLHRTARNVAFDELKARKRVAGDAPLEQTEETDIHTDPQRAALLGEQQEDVRAVAAGLPERMRTALTLRELREMSYDEIAQVLEIPKNSVGVLLMRARVKFKEAFRMSQVTAKELSKECEAMLPRLSAYLDDELGPEEIEEVKTHLDDCPLCRLALEEQAEASKSYRGIVPLAPPAALAADFFAALDEAGAAELGDTPGGGNDMTIEMPKLDLEAEGTPADGAASGRPWYRNPKTWAIVGAAAGAVVLGLLVGAYALDPGPKTTVSAAGEPVLDTYDLDGGIQSSDVPIIGTMEATKALEKTLETEEATETTAAPAGEQETAAPAGEQETSATVTGETSETTSADPASTGPASGDSSPTATDPDTTAPPTPGGLSPSGGSAQENDNVTFIWDTVSDPSGVTYTIELEMLLKNGSWSALAAQTGLAQPSFNHDLGDTLERWRIWAVDGAGNAGKKTDWYLIQRSGVP